jgi:hypothetical protein
MKKLRETLKNIICWSYERTTWQYDLLVVLIIATVIFVPSRFFGDRDRPLRTPNEEVRRWSIESNRINKFAAKNGTADKLKNDPKEIVQLYLREVIRPDILVENCSIEMDAVGKVTGYSVWFQ